MAGVSGTVLKRLPIKSFDSLPGPRSYPVVGTLYKYLPYVGEYSFNRFHRNGMLNYKRYGKLVKEQIIPGVNVLYLIDPADVETMFRAEGRAPFRRSHTALEKCRLDTPELHKSAGILPTNGEEWRTLRVDYQQAISMENCRTFIPQTDEVLNEFLQVLDKPSEKASIHQDLLPYLNSLFCELVGTSLFNHRFNAIETTGKPESFQQRLIVAGELINSSTAIMDNSFLHIWKKIDTPRYRAMKASVALLEGTARDIILRALKNKAEVGRRPSALAIWLKSNLFGETDDIRDAVVMSADLILGGIDTTAYSMSFVFYHLAQNPDKQEKLFTELKSLLPTYDTPMTLEILLKARYLKQCVKEALRLNPISVGVGRLLENDLIIGNCNVPKGTVLVTQGQVTSRLEEYYERPNEFLPERWSPENKRPHPFSSLPFGYGARACIARRLAEQNMYMTTAKMMRKYHLKWNGSAPLDCLTHTINKPDAPVRFIFTPRSQ